MNSNIPNPPNHNYYNNYEFNHAGQRGMWNNNNNMNNNRPLISNPTPNRWGRRGGRGYPRPPQFSRPSVFASPSTRRLPQPPWIPGNSFSVLKYPKEQSAPVALEPAIATPSGEELVALGGVAGDGQSGKVAEGDEELAALIIPSTASTTVGSLQGKDRKVASDPKPTNSAMKMADDKSTDLSQKAYFTVGSQIKCRFQGDDVEGQVAAFNHSDRILMIRSPSVCGKSTDFILINADCVDKISVEDPTPTDNLKPVDFQKLEKRRQKLSANKKSRIRALSAGVPQEARKLFLTIIKTIDEVTWDGDKILVLNEVKISPPYRVEDVKGDKEASVVHVKKIVDKHWKELASNSVST